MPAPLLTTYSPFMLPEGVAGEYAHSPPKSPAKAMMPVLLCSVRRKSTAVRGYAETVHPGSTLTAWVYGPTGTTVHPMTRPPADDLERPTEPM